MPLVPSDNNINRTGTPQAQKSAVPTVNNREVAFAVSRPKYTISEMIITDKVRDEVDTIIKAQECWKKVFEEWNLRSVLKQRENIFVNLYGAPGTGKTMAAHAIASALGKNMICVNYADIESKYVGETSKNLTSLFKTASEKNVIIFFDEADALLSKRVTNMSSSTDVSVNQTRSVLLTLLNDYKRMVLFATNFISNYDPAFMRRIQYHVKFELPDTELRKRLWKRYLPKELPNDVDISDISEKYSGISGSDISNAVLKAALKAAKNDEEFVPQRYFEEAVSEINESKAANSGNVTTVARINEDEVPEEIRMKKQGGSI